MWSSYHGRHFASTIASGGIHSWLHVGTLRLFRESLGRHFLSMPVNGLSRSRINGMISVASHISWGWLLPLLCSQVHYRGNLLDIGDQKLNPVKTLFHFHRSRKLRSVFMLVREKPTELEMLIHNILESSLVGTRLNLQGQGRGSCDRMHECLGWPQPSNRWFQRARGVTELKPY